MNEDDISKKRLSCPEELRLIDGFEAPVEASPDDLKGILKPYIFSRKNFTPCGLKNCQRSHGRGYVIDLKDGRRTNLGRCCGKKFFGVEFSLQANLLDKLERERFGREFLQSLLSRLPELRSRVDLLRTSGFGAVRQSEALRDFHSAYPTRLIELLKQRAASNRTGVSKREPRSEVDQYLLRSSNPGLSEAEIRFEERRIGTLRGLGVVRSSTSAVLLLHERVTQPLRDLELLSWEGHPRVMAALYRRCREIESALREAEKLLAEGVAFFSPSNFALLEFVVEAQHDVMAVRRVRWDFESQCSVEVRARDSGHAFEDLRKKGWIGRGNA